ncbi:mannitol dehydrogenase family protein [Ochrobactrum soli]|uniref:Mannitol dehydrogenase family protein n=1 Tax=Ochrobactrum soli TaxID=2448455 RepID=A0A849KK93_9HYPH|nr:mannitol dehydrogenase family protein [[Ochrobactrum] soli]NNU60057.1 mannitol dehydrogenase family protein [[Ochrobactrum] soli]
MRLSAKSSPTDGATWPAYDPQALDAGILHLGLGAFARAHLAAYTDAALTQTPSDWRIVGVSLRGTDVAEALNPQDGYYTLIVRDEESRAHVIGSVRQALAGPTAGAEALSFMTEPNCRIVSITVTEKGYGLLRSGGCDPAHPAVMADLQTPDQPRGVLGLIALGLKRRFELRLPAFTVLSCDNLPDNGALLRAAVIDFAARAHGPELAKRIAQEVAFPATMVDRITPQPTDQTRADAARVIGCEDEAAIETEPFSQWVIEDHFPAGRPAWEAMRATFTKDVRPFEKMKLRMLNGSHSMLAYAGFLSSKTYVRDVMADAALNRLVQRHLHAAAQTLTAMETDLDAYAQALAIRFANPAIAHETRQIAMDGTEKMPQRIFAPAVELIEQGGDTKAFAFATAAWMRYGLGQHENGQPYPLNDPRDEEITAALANTKSASDIFAAFAALPGLMPPKLKEGPFAEQVVSRLNRMLADSIVAAIHHEAESC